MALGTPSVGGIAYSAQNGTSVSPAYPASIAAGDALLLVVGQKPSTANAGGVTTPSGWTLLSDNLAQGGYGTTIGADVGNTNLRVYTKDVVNGTETGNLAVTLSVNNVSWGVIVRVPAAGGTILYVHSEGADTTGAASMSVTGSPNLEVTTGDVYLASFCMPTDAVTGWSAFTIAQSGITMGTEAQLAFPDSGTGNDIGGLIFYGPVTSGSSTAAATMSATAAGTVTNVRGPGTIVRVRELAALNLNAEPTAYSITGVAATLLDNKHLTAESATYAVTGSNATLARALMVNAEPGSYALTGFDATLVKDRDLNAEPGSYALTGIAVTFEIVGSGKELIAEVGTYSVTGSDAQLAFGDVFNAESGSYDITGSDASLLQGLTLSADPANYNLSGANATLVTDDTLSLESGSYSITGSDATLMLEYMFNAETGTYAVTGNPAEFFSGIVLNAESASYNVTGFAAEINREGSFTASPGSYSLLGANAILGKGLILNAEPATKYVDSGYVDEGYVIQTGYYVNGFPATLAYPRYPLPNQVLLGVLYGPNGNDYVGTYVCPAGINKQILYIFDE